MSSLNIVFWTEIKSFINIKENKNKKILYRYGLDYRFTGREGFSIPGYKRNKEISLDKLRQEANYYFIDFETDECNDSQLVFHGYSANDLY